MINKISDNFYCITLPMDFRLNHVHIYALVHDKEIALFDTGWSSNDSLDVLETDLKSIGLGIKSIRHVYITHAHPDHCGIAGLIKEKSGATIHISAAADESNRNYSNTDLWTRKMKKFYIIHGLPGQEIDDLIALFNSMPDIDSVFQADDLLQSDEIREFGPWQFEAIFTPGHSNGHICYYFRRQAFLLSGDTVLPHITPNLSPDLFDENFRPLQSFLKSLNTVANLPLEKIYPGHGNVFGNVKSRINEICLHHTERMQLILNCLGAVPKTSFQVALEIFGSNLQDFDRFLALNETYVHLLELKYKGIIKEKQAGSQLVYSI
ncbi:MAG: MBL fold metallo-hydrolase [Smithellaceae bacterium]